MSLSATLLVSCIIAVSAAVNVGKPIQVQVLFRHGDRTPSTLMYLPTDNVRLPWPAAAGELTDIGSQQMYKLGNFIRTNLYPTLFDDPFGTYQVRAWAGDDNRTVASALAFMAGYFPERQPPQGSPLAVHIDSTIDDVSSAIVDVDDCPAWAPYLQTTDGYKHFLQLHRIGRTGKRFAFCFAVVSFISLRSILAVSYSALFEYLTEKSGFKVDSLQSANWVLDNLFCNVQHNRSIPSWAYEGPLANVSQYSDYIGAMYYYTFQLPDVQPFVEGFTMNQYSGAFDNFISGRTKHRLMLWSGHDTNVIVTILALGASDQVPKMQNPGYGSHVHLNLYGNASNRSGAYVRAFYASNWNATLLELRINACASQPCLLDDFLRIVPLVSKETYATKCHGRQKDGRDTAISKQGTKRREIERTTVVLSVLAALLTIALLSVITGCCLQQRRIRAASDEQRRLLDAGFQPSYLR